MTSNSLINPEVLKKVDVNINSSTSKQMYTFGKNRRFRDLKPSNETFFYNLPKLQSTRSAAFGFGNRSDFTSSLLKGKAQVYYNLPSDFNTRLHRSPQYSMGKGREECKRPTNNIDKNDPGPGAYNIGKPLGYNSLKFSIFGRDWSNKDENKHKRNYPGPNHYNQKLVINGNGRYPTSTFSNTHGLTFSSAERFKSKFNKNPGPGSYESKIVFNGTGFYFDTKYQSNVAKTMHNRPPQFYRKEKDSGVPGPGSYDFFSDFEGFQRFKTTYNFNRKSKVGKKKKEKENKENKENKNDGNKKGNNEEKKKEKKIESIKKENLENNDNENKDDKKNNEDNVIEEDNNVKKKDNDIEEDNNMKKKDNDIEEDNNERNKDNDIEEDNNERNKDNNVENVA